VNMNQPVSIMGGVQGPPTERQVAVDMIVRRGLPVAPALILVAGLIWGLNGAASAAFGIGLVLVNFGLAALILGWAARISLAFLMGAVLFGYIGRLALITIAVLAVHNQSWVSIVALGMTIIVTHLGLLIWETRYVSASLAFPGLKPTEKGL
jgi:hypothetical protein